MILPQVIANEENIVALVWRGAGQAGAQLGHRPFTSVADEEVGIGKHNDGSILLQVGQNVIDSTTSLLYHHTVPAGITKPIQDSLSILQDS